MRDRLAELLQREQAKRGMPNQQKAKFLPDRQKQYSQKSNQRCTRGAAKLQIRIAVFITLSLCLLAGCQKPPQPYGNFARVDSADLIQDTTSALYAAYPPAKTRLALLLSVEDPFGISLIDSLRGVGYAVTEYASPGKGPSVSTDAGLGFGYTLDALHEDGGLRVTLHIGDEALSRLYMIQGKEEDARYIPAGYWVRLEGRRHAGQ
jgi:hypothetical protein